MKLFCLIRGYFRTLEHFFATFDATEVDGCIFQDIEEHKNKTVIISKCKDCGKIDISWT